MIITASLLQASLFRTLSYLDHESVMWEFLRITLWCIPLWTLSMLLRAVSTLNSEATSDPILQPEIRTGGWQRLRAFNNPISSNWLCHSMEKLNKSVSIKVTTVLGDLWSQPKLFSRNSGWIHLNYGLVHGEYYFYSTACGWGTEITAGIWSYREAKRWSAKSLGFGNHPKLDASFYFCYVLTVTLNKLPHLSEAQSHL